MAGGTAGLLSRGFGSLLPSPRSDARGPGSGPSAFWERRGEAGGGAVGGWKGRERKGLGPLSLCKYGIIQGKRKWQGYRGIFLKIIPASI